MQTTTAFAEAVAGEVRAELAARRLTQANLAKFMRWNTTSLSRILNRPQSMDLAHLEQIALYLGITPLQLVTAATARADRTSAAIA